MTSPTRSMNLIEHCRVVALCARSFATLILFALASVHHNAQAQDYVPQRVIASDATTGDRFGWSIAMLDSTAIVGAPRAMAGAGAAYVFQRQANNEWVELQKLGPAEAGHGAGFGWSIALIDSLAVVGAPYSTGGEGLLTGAAFVFRLGDDGRWEEETQLLPDASSDSAGFGWSVALAPAQLYDDTGSFGPVVFVGAPIAGGGTVHVYERSADGTWSQSAFGSPWGGDADRFGWAVSILATQAYAGSPGALRDDGLTGKAHGFVRDSTGWRLTAEILPPEGLPLHAFGSAVADRAWIGAPGGDEPDAEAGIVRFQGHIDPSDPDSFAAIPAQTFRAGNVNLGPSFGAAIAAGSRGPFCCGSMIVGAPADGAEGRALKMAGGAGFLVGPAGTLEPPTGFQGGGFGTSVTVSLGVFAVGAPGDSGTTSQVGELYFFTHPQELTSSEQPGTSGELRVEGPYPNPTDHETRVQLHLHAPARVTVSLFDAQGREQMTQDFGALVTGVHELVLDTRMLASGVYGYVVNVSEQVVRGTIVVVH